MRADEAIIFQNHPSMRSVPTISHSHVFFRPADDERGRRLAETLGTLRVAWRERSPFVVPAGYERGDKLPPPTTTAGASAKEHLLWSPGVLRSTVQTAAVLFFAWRQASRHPAAEVYLRRLVEWWSSRLLSQAAAWQWWGALSLLSSSCCVVQLLLNSLSLGCAGFNTVLGPVRPAFLALTVLAQYHSVQVGLAARHLHVPMAVATATLSWSLTLAPELVYLYTMWRARARARGKLGRRGGRGGVGADGGADADNGGSASMRECTYTIHMPSMGCVACINSVQGALERVEGVLSVDVALQEKGGTAQVVMARRWEAGAESAASGEHDAQDEALLDAVGAAGFPGTIAATSLPAQSIPASSSSSPSSSTSSPLPTSNLLPHRGVIDLMWSGIMGLLGSSCCLLQLSLNMLSALNIAHVGCGGFNKILGGTVRPAVRSITAAWLVASWIVAAKAATPARTANLRRLAFTTALCLTLTFLPEALRAMGAPGE